MPLPERYCSKEPQLLRQKYFYELGESPDVAMPALEAGQVLGEAEIDWFERLSCSERGCQVIACVMAYSFLRRNPEQPDGYQIWIGARRPEDEVHGNVFSVPTHRLPLDQLRGLLAGRTVLTRTDESIHFDPRWSDMTRKDRPEVDRVDHVLYGKLGGAFGYERRNIHVSLASIGYGKSSVYGRRREGEQERDLEEAIFMLHTLVYLQDSQAEEVIAADPAEYYVTNWATPEEVTQALQAKDHFGFVPEGSPHDPILFCIHGQCMVAATREHRLGISDIHLEDLRARIAADQAARTAVN